jgi:hypothetical protein
MRDAAIFVNDTLDMVWAQQVFGDKAKTSETARPHSAPSCMEDVEMKKDDKGYSSGLGQFYLPFGLR